MSRTVADQFAETLVRAGVKRIYGVVGDSLNGLTDSFRRQGKIDWIHVRHEEAGAFAASAEAHLTGNLAVCAGSCGPGNLHLINGLFDCHRSRVPVLAIAAHIPSAEIGSGYFQETHPQDLFMECSHYCELASDPAQMPRMLEIAIRTAIGERGVSVIVIPGDIALRPAITETAPKAASLLPKPPIVVPRTEELAALAKVLNGDGRVTIFCGSGCAGAHAEVLRLAEKLKAPVVHTLKGKEHVEYDNPCDVGMTGLIGFASGYYAMIDCDVLLMLGTDFPYRQFYPKGAGVVIAQIDIRPGQIGRRTSVDLGLVGDVGVTIAALLPMLTDKTQRKHLDDAIQHYQRTRAELDELAQARPGKRPIHPQLVAKAISDFASDEAIFTCDVGLPTVWAARYLKMKPTMRRNAAIRSRLPARESDGSASQNSLRAHRSACRRRFAQQTVDLLYADLDAEGRPVSTAARHRVRLVVVTRRSDLRSAPPRCLYANERQALLLGVHAGASPSNGRRYRRSSPQSRRTRS